MDDLNNINDVIDVRNAKRIIGSLITDIKEHDCKLTSLECDNLLNNAYIGISKCCFKAKKILLTEPFMPIMEDIRVLEINPNKPPMLNYIPNNKKFLEQIIGGNIEIISDGYVGFVVNKYGKSMGLDSNKHLFFNPHSEMVGCDYEIYGKTILLGIEDNYFRSLTDSEVKFFMNSLKEYNEVAFQNGKKVY